MMLVLSNESLKVPEVMLSPGKVNVDEIAPRTTGRQQHRSSVPSSTPSEYFKRQLTIPALDYLRSEISERFSSSSSTILSQIMKLLPVSVAAKKTSPLPT